VEPDGYGVGGASEHDGYLAVGELFPGGQLKDFDEGRGELRQGVEYDFVLAAGSDGVGGARVCGGAELGETGEEFVSTDIGSTGVGHDPSGDGEEPGVVIRGWGDLADASPGNQEGFRGDVLGSGGSAAASAGVGDDVAVVGVEELTELAFGLSRGRVLLSSGPRRATTPGSVLAGHHGRQLRRLNGVDVDRRARRGVRMLGFRWTMSTALPWRLMRGWGSCPGTFHVVST
jgi:hypothetical protein